jgi:hypothetical protein
MLWSQFSAMFAYFRQTNGVVLKNRCCDQSFTKKLSVVWVKNVIFRHFFAKYFKNHNISHRLKIETTFVNCLQCVGNCRNWFSDRNWSWKPNAVIKRFRPTSSPPNSWLLRLGHLSHDIAQQNRSTNGLMIVFFQFSGKNGNVPSRDLGENSVSNFVEIFLSPSGNGPT